MRRLIPNDPEARMLVFMMLVCLLLVAVLAWALTRIPRAHGHHNAQLLMFVNESPSLDKFGIYSVHYMEMRWQRMCRGPARYDAMREAAELNHGNPC